jgi:transposase
MYKDLQEQTEKAELMERENESLRHENNGLRKKVESLQQRIDALTESLDERVEAAVARAIEPLNKTIKKKDEEIVRLKGIINKDSSNSSKPPSGNGFKKIANSREVSEKKPGGQPGHPGRHLTKPANWGELKAKGLAIEEVDDHTNKSEPYETRCVLDIDMKVKWTEHRYKLGAPELRETPSPVIYGSKVKALVILLGQVEFVPQERLCEFIGSITHGGIRMSEGTVNRILQQFSEKLSPELKQIENDLLNGEVLHTDETPMKATQWAEYDKSGKEMGLQKSEKSSETVYVRTHSNAQTTLFTVNRHKDIAGVERDGLLGRFQGILSHDHDRKFYRYGREHATCGEHLARDLKGIADGYGCVWPNEMRSFLYEMNEYKKKDIAAHIDKPQGCTPEQYEAYSKRYDELLKDGIKEMTETGNQNGQDELRKMLERLREYKNEYLLFMKKYIAPFTNNLAERDLRPCKGKQKMSGCHRGWAGVVAFTRARSFLSTIRKRGLDVIDSIFAVLAGIPVLA